MTTLGLDLGTNSIGWTLLGHDAAGMPSHLIAGGVRIFSAGIEDQTQAPLNWNRRTKRLLRRQLARRRQRRDLVRNLLLRHGLLPPVIADDTKPEGVWNRLGEVYALRAKALDQPLLPHELGRIFMHLQRHRGFQSNRRADRGAKEADEATATDAGIGTVKARMSTAGARTLGEWLQRQPQQRNTAGIRWLYSERAMHHEEFAAIWQAQAAFHPTLLTDALYGQVFRALFWQRPLKSQAGSIGACALHPPKRFTKSDGTEVVIPVPRAAMAWQESQRARMIQDVNHLALRDPRSGVMTPLLQRERDALIERLDDGDLTWTQARKIIGRIRGGETLTKHETFNIEEGGKDKLFGNRTAARLRRELEGTPIAWDELPVGDATRIAAGERSQAALIKDLLTIDQDQALQRRLVRFWGLSDLDARKVAQVELDARPGRLSLKALKALLPHLLAGKNYHDAAQAAGFQRIDQQAHAAVPRLGAPPAVRNPVVAKCLHELRKVVNALIRVHGLPSIIRVELARDLRLTPKQKADLDAANKRLRSLNAAADAFWNAAGVANPSHDDRVKYRLWKAQNELSAYSDRPISQELLRSGAVQIDHILPYSRSFDDSFGNKALCFVDENIAKGNRTPHEWLGGEPARWEALMQRLRTWKNLAPGTRMRMTLTTLESDDFLARQLNDTRWLSRAAVEYLGALYPSHRRTTAGEQRFHYPVQVTAGKATAGLRHFWGLNSVLSADGMKHRDDHRHHLVDAVVIACTDRRLYQQISHTAGRPGAKPLEVEPPWPGLRVATQALVAATVVSHAQDHRITGALHEETAYGVAGAPDAKGMRDFCYRVPVQTAASKPAKIRDDAVRALVEARLAQHSGDAKKAFAEPLLHRDGKTPIHTVRIVTSFNQRSVRGFPAHQPTRWHKLGGNHHVELVRSANGRVHGRFVTTIEAAERARRKRIPVIDRTIGTDEAFCFALHINDTVEVPCADGVRLYRVQSMSVMNGTQQVIQLRDARASGIGNNEQRLFVTPNSMIEKGIRPVHVDALGRVTRHADPGRGDRQPGEAAPG